MPRTRQARNANKAEWTKNETSQLIASVNRQLMERDPLIYRNRIKQLNWKKIKVPFKSSENCKKQLDFIIKKNHRTRTLAEILSDVNISLDIKRSRRGFVEYNVKTDANDTLNPHANDVEASNPENEVEMETGTTDTNDTLNPHANDVEASNPENEVEMETGTTDTNDTLNPHANDVEASNIESTGTTDNSSNTNHTFVGHTEDIEVIQAEDEVQTAATVMDFNYEEVKEEIRESPSVYTCIKRLCKGWFDRIVPWAVKKE